MPLFLEGEGGGVTIMPPPAASVDIIEASLEKILLPRSIIVHKFVWLGRSISWVIPQGFFFFFGMTH